MPEISLGNTNYANINNRYITFNSDNHTNQFKTKVCQFTRNIPDFSEIEIKRDASNIRIFIDGQEVNHPSKKIRKQAEQLFKQNNNQAVCIKHDYLGERIKEKVTDLYLYSSGGGGHKAAKDALFEAKLAEVIEELKDDVNVRLSNGIMYVDAHPTAENDPRLASVEEFINWSKKNGIIEERDCLHDFLGWIGRMSSKVWDDAQKARDVKKQEKLASKQWLSDRLFGPFIFLATLYNLIKHRPTAVVSTQAMATPSILHAVKLYNKRFKPEGQADVLLNLYMTDFPTVYARHFNDALQRIKDEEAKKYLILHAPESKDPHYDWKAMTGLEEHQIRQLKPMEYPVRRGFLKAAESFTPNLEKPEIEIKVSCKEELKLLNDVLKHQHPADKKHFANKNQKIQHYQTDKEDERFFIMQGSQPAPEVIKRYIECFIQQAKDMPEKKFHIFAYTGAYNVHQGCFYKELCKYIKEQKVWPENLTVIPLSFQDDPQNISLRLQCDTITRSGGGTIMEDLVMLEIEKILEQNGIDLPKRMRYVHAESYSSSDNLVENIPLWERGNFERLQEEVGNKRAVAVNYASFDTVLDERYELLNVDNPSFDDMLFDDTVDLDLHDNLV